MLTLTLKAEQHKRNKVMRVRHSGVPMTSALDEGGVMGVSSVAHLRDGNRAFKV